MTVKLPVTVPVAQLEEAAGVLVMEAKQCRTICSSPWRTEDNILVYTMEFAVNCSLDHSVILCDLVFFFKCGVMNLIQCFETPSHKNTNVPIRAELRPAT